MKRPRGFAVYAIFFAIGVVLLGALAFNRSRTSAVAAAYEKQAEFEALGRELQGASEYLTEEVRHYTQFGVQRHYDNYWKEVRETRTRDAAVVRLEELGASPDLLALVEQAKKSSDVLIALEDSAMKEVARGRFDEARQLVFGPAYDDQVAVIMAPIDSFRSRLASATAADVAAARRQAAVSFVVLALTCMLTVLGLALGFLMFQRRFAGPIAHLRSAADRLSRGELVDSVTVERRDDLGLLVESFNMLIDSTRAQATSLQCLARGDVDREITLRGEGDVLGNAMRDVRESLRELLRAVETLVAAATEGELSRRADASTMRGGFATLLTQVNAMLDAIASPVNEAGRALEKLAARDLTARVQGTYKGDHAKIKGALNTAAENLERALADVSLASGELASASGQITQASQQLASGASEQASSLEEVSSSLQELASMTRQNAGNAQEARSLTESARGSVQNGVAGMRDLSAAVSRIKSSSDATAKIVKTIDEIAFQTNLLALNAAVEAARAGDAGKGFAVVADEVRALALRSAEAAKNTAALIEESVSNAEGGVQLNASVLKNLEEIQDQVEKVTEVMSEIAAASEQQSQGVTQISTAIEQMNGVTQQVAASSEETASTAEELNAQAEMLRGLVSGFEINETGMGRGGDTRGRKPASGGHGAGNGSRGSAARSSNGHAKQNGHTKQNGHGAGHASAPARAATGTETGSSVPASHDAARPNGAGHSGNGVKNRIAADLIPFDDDDLTGF